MNIRKTPTILVVEDDAEGRAATLKVLESVGYKTMEADNGQQGLDLILQEDIHAASPRRGKPLIKISCAALPEILQA